MKILLRGIEPASVKGLDKLAKQQGNATISYTTKATSKDLLL